MRRRRSLEQVNRGLVAAVTAIALTLVVAPGSAHAEDGVLIPDKPQLVYLGNTASWAFNTTQTYWSAVAVQPTSGMDFDLSVSNESGVLAQSASRDDVTEWVAINSNIRPVWSYRATVTRHSGSRPGEKYRIQLAQTNKVLRSEWFEQYISLGNGPSRFPGFIAVRDIWLDAGRAMLLFATPTCEPGERNLVQAAVLSPSTSVATAADAVAASAQTGCPATAAVRYEATETGWHGLVIYVNNQRLPRPTEVEVQYSVGIP